MNGKVFLFGVLLVALNRVSVASEMCAAAGEMTAASEPSFTGVVQATTNASRYTYVQIKGEKQTIWAAAPACSVKVGDRVTANGGMLTKNFTSKTLNRKFDELYMCGSILPAGGAGTAPMGGAGLLPAGHPKLTGGEPAADMPVIKKPEGGKTVAEVWAEKSILSGKTVTVRGKVIKVSKRILGKNWLHLRDGTGIEGQNDLTVTTKAEPVAGDVVTITGTLATDRDFGSGYRYDVIVEDASVVGK